MAEAFAIFGVVAGAIGTSEAIKKWIKVLRKLRKELREVGDTIEELYDKYVVVQIRFNHWAERYGLDVSSTTATLQNIWGNRGSRSILIQLSGLSKLIDRFNSNVALLLSDRVLDILDPNVRDRYPYSSRPNPLSRRVVEAATISERVKQIMSTEEKLDFLKFGKDSLERDLDVFKQTLIELQRDGEDFDLRKVKQRAEELSLNVQTADETPELLRIALATKAASNALYTSCFATPRAGISRGSLTNYIKLEMRLQNEFENESEPLTPQSLRFHLLLALPQIERPLEILITGPIDWIAGRDILLDEQRYLLDACEAVMNNAPCEFTASFDSQPLRFRSCLPRDPIHAEQKSFMPLSILFQELKRDRITSESFRLPDKIDLAHRIAEYGLLLLGTSWLSSLRCKNIQRHKAPRDRQRFVLEAKPLSSRLSSSAINVTGEQIFWIGILLAEVAIGQSFFDLQDSNGNLELKTTSFHHGILEAWYPTSEIVRQVHNVSGMKLARAVEFCFEKRPGAPHWRKLRRAGPTKEPQLAHDTLMWAYYNQVYHPLEIFRGEFWQA